METKEKQSSNFVTHDWDENNEEHEMESICFEVKQIDELYKQMREGGARVSELKGSGSCGRSFYFFDPDGNVQYASKEYQKLLKRHGFLCSMSRKGNCYDNAPMESFWGKLKMEWLNERIFKTRAEAKKAIFEYIELFYNRRRTHSSNNYVPPFMIGQSV